MNIIVTGGAGFIGSALVRRLVKETEANVIVLDKLTYAGTLSSIKEVSSSPRCHFVQGDICDRELVTRLFHEVKPERIMHLAAESHVDRSIDAPLDFVNTNVVGTATLLQAALEYWRTLPDDKREAFRFQHISTDEVYGTLGETGYFREDTPYSPHSPYSASKASSDHFVRAWHDTFGLPVLITNCSNNYGPYQFPEKLIPLVTLNALEGRELPVYGTGANVRDWLFVEDHVTALCLVGDKGTPGRTYNIGGHSERSNIQVVRTICGILDEIRPRQDGRKYEEQIRFVKDRPGHDLRYAIDADRIAAELGWKPSQTFQQGMRLTVQWYLDNAWWWKPLREQRYSGQRLGNDK